ncbi:vacuolar protein sorting-associated protein 16 homolog [Neodiprion pinetum]|uniref:vacuolar protein sorting-associated protein 16 homolog n=1 Tax=Neodiprion pinetum TaxID=441929 RepID=UPI001EE02B3F|nr:vacuolar protein sorting-associated protein 16 homolog [Neodiprion pinetum]XP_046492708.1 vacuolar protein sorting-associated protein 16 homolog [Neodiprion pinetum]
MSVMLTADWFPLGRDKYFRKFELYPVSFHQEVSNQNFIAAAPYGGPIAVTRDPNKLVKVQGANKPIISIYSSSGKLMAPLQWNSGQLVLLGWSHQEELLCVQDDGMVLIYDMFGTYQHAFGMGNEAKETKVVAAKYFPTVNGTGVAVLTSTNRIFLVNNVSEPKVRQVAEIPKTGGSIDCWCIVPTERDSHIVAANQEGIYQIQHMYQKPSPIPFSTYFTNNVNNIIRMAVSGNNRHIALYSDTGCLYLGSVDLKKKYCECFTNITDPLSDIAWCGTEAVVCCWNSVLMVVGRTGETIMYTYDGPVHLITEIDGVRVLSSSSHEMIQKVPNVVQKIFRINSTDSASYLLEASKQFQKRSHKADSYIDLVKEKLDTAIQDCIEAASYEFDFETQKLLMRAAKFGKGFSRSTNPDVYVTMCRQLRVLNAVRHHTIGIPLTYTQLQVLSSQVLLHRLVARRHYYLSIQIARHLQLPEVDGESRILAHWACYKVKQTQLDKEQIAEEIADKLGYAPGVSYSEIAIEAANCGRKQLAIKLIDYEPRAQLQVPLLLRLGEERAALYKAVESGNTDLVYTVIFHLRENMPLADFQRFIMRSPLAMALYIKYCQGHNRETLRDIYSQDDDFHSQALWFIREGYQQKNSLSRDTFLQSAHENFKLARNDLNAALTEEQIKLLRYQRSLADTLHQPVVGKPLHDTVKLLLLQNEIKLADKLRSEYKLPDKRYWWLRIQCLAENGLWMELEKFSKSKKSPIGYEPFIEECLKYKKNDEAKKYLPRVREELKVKYFAKVGMLLEAAQIALEQKDQSALEFVVAQCGPADKHVAEKINAMKASL